MIRITLYIDEIQHRRLVSLNQPGVNFSEHIRRAIDEYLEKFTPETTPTKSPTKGGHDA